MWCQHNDEKKNHVKYYTVYAHIFMSIIKPIVKLPTVYNNVLFSLTKIDVLLKLRKFIIRGVYFSKTYEIWQRCIQKHLESCEEIFRILCTHKLLLKSTSNRKFYGIVLPWKMVGKIFETPVYFPEVVETANPIIIIIDHAHVKIPEHRPMR